MKNHQQKKSSTKKVSPFLIISLFLIILIFIITGNYFFSRDKLKNLYNYSKNEEGESFLKNKVITDIKWDIDYSDDYKMYFKIPLTNREFSSYFECTQEDKIDLINKSLLMAKQFNSDRINGQSIFKNPESVRVIKGSFEPRLVLFETRCTNENNMLDSNIVLLFRIKTDSSSWFEAYSVSINTNNNFETNTTTYYYRYNYEDLDFLENPNNHNVFQISRLADNIYVGIDNDYYSQETVFNYEFKDIGSDNINVYEKIGNKYITYKGTILSTKPLDKNFTRIKKVSDGYLLSANDWSAIGQYTRLMFIDTTHKKVKTISLYKDTNGYIDAQADITEYTFTIKAVNNYCKSDKTMNKYGSYRVFTYIFEYEGKEILVESCYNKFNNYIYIKRGNDNPYRYIPTKTQTNNYLKGITFNQNIFENPNDGKLIINIFGKDYSISFK